MEFLNVNNITAFLTDQLANNQFSQGAIVAAFLALLIGWGRNIPVKIYDGLRKFFTLTVRFNSDNGDYKAISKYVSENLVKEMFSRNYLFQTQHYYDNYDDTRKIVFSGLVVGYGNHYGFYKGTFVIVSRVQEQENIGSEYKEYTTIRFITRSRKKVEQFSSEMSESIGTNTIGFKNVPIFVNNFKNWQKMGTLPLRKMNTVITKDNKGKDILKLIKDFENQKARNHELGLPHHLGIMLHGKAGCGKSSLIHAIASETKRSIAYLNLGSVESDNHLTGLFSADHDWDNKILAIEDIDAAGLHLNRNNNDDDTNNGSPPVTLSALLNVLDGILCPDGLIVIATTNHHDRLDTALVRQGRFDKTFSLGDLGHKEMLQMAKLFDVQNTQDIMGPEDTMSGSAMRSLMIDMV